MGAFTTLVCWTGLRERVCMMPTDVIVVADRVCDAFGLLKEVERV